MVILNRIAPDEAVLRRIGFELRAIDVQDIGVNHLVLNQMFIDIDKEVFETAVQAFIDQSLESHM